MVAAQRHAEITLQRIDREAVVLRPERLIDAELVAQILELLRRRPVAEEQRRDVARQHMHREEDDDAHPDQDEDELHEPPHDVLRHGRLRRSERGRAKAARLPV